MGWGFVLFIVQLAISIYTASQQEGPDDAVAAKLGEFEAPTAEEGIAVPVAFGTVQIKAPNVVWYGDLKTDPIRSSGGKK